MDLRELRISLGLTQLECANYLKMSLRNYQNYENNITKNIAKKNALSPQKENPSPKDWGFPFGRATHESDRALRAPRAESGSVSPRSRRKATRVSEAFSSGKRANFRRRRNYGVQNGEQSRGCFSFWSCHARNEIGSASGA